MSSILTPYLRAAAPAVAVETVEEERFLADLLRSEIARNGNARTVLGCNALGTIGRWALSPHGVPFLAPDASAQTKGFPAAIATAASQPGTIMVLQDAHHVCANPPFYRCLKSAMPALKSLKRGDDAAPSMIVLLAPTWTMPPELRHDVPVIAFELPTREQLRAVMDGALADYKIEADEAHRTQLLDAASGLTLQEAEQAFYLSFRRDGMKLDVSVVEAEKLKLIKSTGYLEVTKPVPPEMVGGLSGYKTWVTRQVVPTLGDAQLRIRGVMFVGVPGTGKSLCSKALGSLLKRPVIRLDFAACKGGLVGQSESNLRNALRLADAIAPCVLWCDEIEKAVGGYAGSAQTDGGTTLGMVGILLTWLQEHMTDVIVVATCNDHAKLPPELSRAGRFDQRFFVDLPSLAERREIATVHLARFNCPLQLAPAIASATVNFTGAEIEEVVKSAARLTMRKLTTESIAEAVSGIRPIALTSAEEIKALREWAKGALVPANGADEQAAPRGRREVSRD